MKIGVNFNSSLTDFDLWWKLQSTLYSRAKKENSDYQTIRLKGNSLPSLLHGKSWIYH